MTVLKVTEVKEPLVIGKFYLVPCVTMPFDIEVGETHLIAEILARIRLEPDKKV